MRKWNLASSISIWYFFPELKKVNLPNKKVQKSCFYIKSGSIQESHFHLCSYVSHLVGMENYLVLHRMNIDHRKWIPKQAKLAWDMITSEKMIRNLDVQVLCKILIHWFTYVLFSYSDIFACQFRISNIHVSGIYCTHIQSWPTDINALVKLTIYKTNCFWLTYSNSHSS